MFVAMPTREIHPIVKTAPSATLKNRLHPQHGSAIGHVYVCRPGVDSTTALSPVHSIPQWSHTHVYCMYGVARLHMWAQNGRFKYQQLHKPWILYSWDVLYIHIQPHPCATPTHQPLLWRLDPTCAKSCYLSPLFPAKSHLHSFSPALGHMN